MFGQPKVIFRGVLISELVFVENLYLILKTVVFRSIDGQPLLLANFKPVGDTFFLSRATCPRTKSLRKSFVPAEKILSGTKKQWGE